MRNAIIAATVAALLASGAVQAQTTAAAQATPTASDLRTVAPENLLVIDTTKGRILVELAPDVAPLHVERIRLLARNGFFDNLTWHRVIDLFMAQTGDPLGNGEGQSAYPDLKAEFTFRRDRALQVGDGDNGMMAQAQPDRMTRVRVAADLPEADRPTVQVLATDSVRFHDLVTQTRTARGADFSVCDVTLPVQVQ